MVGGSFFVVFATYLVYFPSNRQEVKPKRKQYEYKEIAR